MSNLEIKDMKEIALGMLREALSEERTRKNIVVELDGKLPSALSAALLIEALGYKRVIIATMPDGEMSDEQRALVEHFHAYHVNVDISGTIDAVFSSVLEEKKMLVTVETEDKLPKQIRAITLDAVASSMRGQIVHPCNSANDILYGITVEDENILTDEQVVELAMDLGLPEWLWAELQSETDEAEEAVG